MMRTNTARPDQVLMWPAVAQSWPSLGPSCRLAVRCLDRSHFPNNELGAGGDLILFNPLTPTPVSQKSSCIPTSGISGQENVWKQLGMGKRIKHGNPSLKCRQAWPHFRTDTWNIYHKQMSPFNLIANPLTGKIVSRAVQTDSLCSLDCVFHTWLYRQYLITHIVACIRNRKYNLDTEL